MPTDDLTTLPGLDDRQRAVLAQELDITTSLELIMAERQRVVSAFEGRADAPTIDDVAAWQDEARRSRHPHLKPANQTTSPGWEQVAIFLVAFEQRHVQDTSEQRVVAEQAEVESEGSGRRFEQVGWTAEGAIHWMQARVPETAPGRNPTDLSASTEPDLAADLAATAEPSDGSSTVELEAPVDPPPAIELKRAYVQLVSATIELAAASQAVEPQPSLWDRPVRLVVNLGPVPSSAPSVVLQLERPGHPKENLAARRIDDADALDFGIDVSGVESGHYAPTIVVAALDGSALPCLVRLPMVQVIGVGADAPQLGLDSPADGPADGSATMVSMPTP